MPTSRVSGSQGPGTVSLTVVPAASQRNCEPSPQAIYFSHMTTFGVWAFEDFIDVSACAAEQVGY